MSDYEYDVAFSFAGEQRQYVKDVYDYLGNQGVKVFYDQDETVDTETWGANLRDYFQDIFKNKARFCVVFISQEYANKVWTNFERQIIQARQLVDTGYILPARFDNTTLAGDIETTKYVNLVHLTPQEFGDMIIRKLKSATLPTAPPEITFRMPRVPKSFNPYTEQEEWIKAITGEVVKRCQAASDLAVECSHFQRSDKDCLRIVHNGETVYALDIHRGDGSNDEGLAFSQAENSSRMSGGYQAMGKLLWSKEAGTVVIELMDFSLFDMLSTNQHYTREQFIDRLWDKIVDIIESRYQ